MVGAAGFDEDDLRNLAGSRSFTRGLGYLDAVSGLDVGACSVTAVVRGTDSYGVELLLCEGGGVLGACDCPYGQQGHFCKHCVAVGLAVLRRGDEMPRRRAAAVAREGALETWLEERSRGELLALVRELIAGDRGVRRRLELRAAAARADPDAVGERVATLVDPRPFARYGYVECADAPGYARQVAEAADALRALTAGGRAERAVRAAQEALGVLDRALEEVDDPEGVVAEAAAVLAGAHLEACRAARPDPRRLAEWLAGRVLGDGAVTDLDPLDYAGVLGPEGLARLRNLADGARRGGAADRPAAYLLERLAGARDALDALIARHAADPDPSGATHLRIAGRLDAAGRSDEALAWAERGLREAGARADGRLVDYVGDRYARGGRADEALALRRDRLRAEPSLAAYRSLRAAALAADRWKDECEAARAVLRQDARAGHRDGGSALLDALLDDGDLDAAWREAAAGADDRQWRRLADLSRATRPADALAVYLRLADALRRPTGDRAYERLAGLLLDVRACHRALGTEERFTAYLAALRADLGRRRRLLAVLDRHGL